MVKKSLIQIGLFCVVALTGCGGDSSDNNGIDNSDFIDSKGMASVLVGIWKGELTYSDGATYCKWALKVNLKNTHYQQQLDGFFKGRVTANLVSSRYVTSARKACMVQGQVDLQWYSYAAKKNDEWKYTLSFSYWNNDDYNFGQNSDIETPSELFSNPLFSNDKAKFKNFRLNSDDPIINLNRSN